MDRSATASSRHAGEPRPTVRDEGPSARVAEAIRRLRAAGERLTPGRRAVLRVLDEQASHLDAEAIATRVGEIEPGVHRATVYRSLQAMVDLGLVAHTHVPNGATIYHLALHEHEQPDGEEREFHAHGHAHLQCVNCQRFTDVPAAEFADLVLRVKQLTGFAIDAEHAALLGRCRECRDSS